MGATKEKYKTEHNVFDEFTNRNLFKLITQQYFDGLQGQLSLGKEANVFIAEKDTEKVIIKIYRLETCDFNKMYDYIKYDPRFMALKKQRRKVIFSWTQREFRNLLTAREVKVRVPLPIHFKDNILIEEFIGNEQAAPMLKDKKPKNPKQFLKDVIEQMRRLYKGGLVHADLSGFNILNFDEKPVLIDFSQATPLENSHAKEYLERDIRNVLRVFEKYGVESDAEKVMQTIVKK